MTKITIHLSKEEFEKRIKNKNITLEKLKSKHEVVKKFYSGIEDENSPYYNSELSKCSKELKNYLGFFLLTKNDKNNKPFKKDIYIIFNSMAFGLKYGYNSEKIGSMFLLIRNYWYDTNFEFSDNIFCIQERYLREGINESILYQELSKDLELLSYSDVKNNFKIHDKVKIDKYNDGMSIIFGIIKSMEFSRGDLKWIYRLDNPNSLYFEDELIKPTQEEINNFYS